MGRMNEDNGATKRNLTVMVRDSDDTGGREMTTIQSNLNIVSFIDYLEMKGIFLQLLLKMGFKIRNWSTGMENGLEKGHCQVLARRAGAKFI